MWTYATHKLRSSLPTVQLSGPSSAGEPLTNYTWWVDFASHIASTATIPDQYTWHMEGGTGDLLSAHDGLVRILSNYSLPMRTININEYGTFPEQVPAGSAWWISQLERIDAFGLRGNWLSGFSLHDFLASLISKHNATDSENKTAYHKRGYFPNGDWQLYKYYAMNMTGHRIGTTPSGDLKLDAYATAGGADGIARVLAGVRVAQGTWYVQLENLSALGLPKQGSVNVRTLAFPVGSDVHYGEIDGPRVVATTMHAYQGDSLTLEVVQKDNTTAYAFEVGMRK